MDNDQSIKLGELSSYFARIFNIEKGDILYRDSDNKEIISPSIKIVNMMILYPQKYKTLIISNKREPLYSNNIPRYQQERTIDREAPIQESNYISTSINQISQIKGDNPNMGPIPYDEKKRHYHGISNNTLGQPNTIDTRNTNYMQYQSKPKSSQPKEIFSTMQSGEFEQTIDDTYPNNPSNMHYTQRVPKTQTPNRGRNPYSLLTKQPKQQVAGFVPTESINKINEKIPAPIDVRYKSEKRIYRERERRKSKEPFDVGSDYNGNVSGNNLIMSNDGSVGEDELKFKPSYPVAKYNTNNTYKNNFRSGIYDMNDKKENMNKSSKQFFQKNRVFNEDFLDNE